MRENSAPIRRATTFQVCISPYTPPRVYMVETRPNWIILSAEFSIGALIPSPKESYSFGETLFGPSIRSFLPVSIFPHLEAIASISVETHHIWGTLSCRSLLQRDDPIFIKVPKLRGGDSVRPIGAKCLAAVRSPTHTPSPYRSDRAYFFRKAPYAEVHYANTSPAQRLHPREWRSGLLRKAACPISARPAPRIERLGPPTRGVAFVETRAVFRKYIPGRSQPAHPYPI